MIISTDIEIQNPLIQQKPFANKNMHTHYTDNVY